MDDARYVDPAKIRQIVKEMLEEGFDGGPVVDLTWSAKLLDLLEDHDMPAIGVAGGSTVWGLWLERDGFQLIGIYAREASAAVARYTEGKKDRIPLELLHLEPIEVHP